MPLQKMVVYLRSSDNIDCVNIESQGGIFVSILTVYLGVVSPIDWVSESGFIEYCHWTANWDNDIDFSVRDINIQLK